MIKRILTLSISLFLLTGSIARADEGMWLPNLLKKLNEGDMQKLGLKLSAEDIYSVNHSSLKDAIVHFGGFCSGEMVSEEGLILTNHHCGFDAIQSNSTVEHDYITDGFWAKTKSEELPIDGLYVRYLISMEDVTAKVKAELAEGLDEVARDNALTGIFKKLSSEAKGDSHYEMEVKPFFNGNEFYMLTYERFDDVRLVGAPPSSIGNFGGDTDNWMWPRHTGDFSMFRVYSGKDGKPAKYSTDNVPYKPKHFLPVSTAGVKKNDFTMTFGYPGRTDRYLTSDGVRQAIAITSPATVKIRTKILDVMKEDMGNSNEVRIQYASKYARVSNYWKYFIGQTKGLKRMRVVEKKEAEERAFQNWADSDPGRKEQYGNVLPGMKAGYAELEKYAKQRTYLNEAIVRGPEILLFAYGHKSLLGALENKESKPEAIKAMTDNLQQASADFYKEFNPPTDQKLVSVLMALYYKDVPADQLAPVFTEIQSKYKGDFEKYAADMFKNSIFASEAKYKSFMEKPSAKTLSKDPAYHAITSIFDDYNTRFRGEVTRINNDLGKYKREYLAGLMQMQPSKKFAPDANSTMRLSYGKVKEYIPMDAVFYTYYTTADGILEKMDNDNKEFMVDPKLEQLIRTKDFGPYGVNGKLPVCFISDNDITGGNSGSCVINGRGELVGIAFDGNWEAMSGDIAYDPEYKRTISVDIRYVLFVIDKFAGAGHLIKEMKLVDGTQESTDANEAKDKASAN